MAFVAYGVTRSPVGQRYDGRYSVIVRRIGGYRPPRLINNQVFAEIGWGARRILPPISALFITKICFLWQGRASAIPLTTTDWLTINAIVGAVFILYLPFAQVKRNGPLSLWMAFLFGAIYILAAIVFLSGQWIARSGHLLPWWPLGEAISVWVTGHSWGDAAGLTGTLLGLGLSYLALADSAPPIGSPETTPPDLGEALGLDMHEPPPAADAHSETPPPHTPRTVLPSKTGSGRKRRKSKRRKKKHR